MEINDIDKELLYLHDVKENEIEENKENEIFDFIKNEIEKMAHLINDEKYVENKSNSGIAYLQIIHTMIDAYNKSNDELLNNSIQIYINKNRIEHIIHNFKNDTNDVKKHYIKRIRNMQKIPTNFDTEKKELASLFG